MIYLDLANVKWHQNRFSKFSLGKHFTFFQFSQWIFYEFSKFLMFWKEEMLLVNSSLISIYEICRQVSGSLLRKYFAWFSAFGQSFGVFARPDPDPVRMTRLLQIGISTEKSSFGDLFRTSPPKKIFFRHPKTFLNRFLWFLESRAGVGRVSSTWRQLLRCKSDRPGWPERQHRLTRK